MAHRARRRSRIGELRNCERDLRKGRSVGAAGSCGKVKTASQQVLPLVEGSVSTQVIRLKVCVALSSLECGMGEVRTGASLKATEFRLRFSEFEFISLSITFLSGQ